MIQIEFLENVNHGSGRTFPTYTWFYGRFVLKDLQFFACNSTFNMGLFRAGSEVSTISQAQRKVTKFQKILSICNVFLLVTSILIIFSAVVLMKFYQIDKLDFWSTYFEILPIFKILLGVFTFLVSRKMLHHRKFLLGKKSRLVSF